MPPHHHKHHRHAPRRRGAISFDRPEIYEESVVLDYPQEFDVLFVPPTDERVEKVKESGDILPTTPASFITALEIENPYWQTLYNAVIEALSAGQIGTDFSFPFTNDFFAWKTFYETSHIGAPVGWEPMSQLQEWKVKRAMWANQLQAKTGKRLPGNIDTIIPRESSPNVVSDSMKIILGVTGLVAVWYLGPTISRMLKGR